MQSVYPVVRCPERLCCRTVALSVCAEGACVDELHGNDHTKMPPAVFRGLKHKKEEGRKWGVRWPAAGLVGVVPPSQLVALVFLPGHVASLRITSCGLMLNTLADGSSFGSAVVLNTRFAWISN